MEKAVKVDINPFSKPSSTSDLVLLVEEHKLHVSKAVLSLASPVFERMFDGDFKEKSSSEIPLPDKKVADFVKFLMCIYPSSIKPITRENLGAVLALADEYQVQPLIDQCEAFMLNRFNIKATEHPPIEDLVHFLFLADKYKFQPLLGMCIDEMKDRNYLTGECAEKIPEFHDVSLPTRYKILHGRMEHLEPNARGVIMGGPNLRRYNIDRLEKESFKFK